MKMLMRWALLGLVLAGAARLAAEDLVRREWTVDGTRRTALLHVPAGRGPAPVVFVFHGHGGSMRNAADTMPVHRLWPEVLVVYPQGLPTAGQLTDRAGREAGWQSGPGAEGDRDLRFFDAMLRDLVRDGRVDQRRVYAMGHSNGGSFTYLLWATRRDVFAAFGPSSAIAGRGYPPLKPAPVVHVAGREDQLVRFSWQEHQINELRRIDACGDGRKLVPEITLYESKTGTPVETFIHPGGHRLPPEAARVIVEFFKAQARP
ncbi:MAG TPA: PHB depolymerase family esterase [Lacunisphaera sp.]|nr:PHB depolymerase family esterase [Lacunisphaera sp.]